MEPKFSQIRLPSSSNPGGQTFVPRTVTWICLPYFTLERYSGLLAADNPRLFPIQTLLQAQFAGTTRERDLQQAVVQRKGSPEVCFHIAQLWCLILDNCTSPAGWSNEPTRMSEHDLCSGSIYGVTDSPQGLSTLKPEPTLLVRYRGDVVWSIPAAECQSWFSFLAHFREFWPNSLQFFRHKEQVTADDWSKIYLPSGFSFRLPGRVGFPGRYRPLPRAPATRLLEPLDRGEPSRERDGTAAPKTPPSTQDAVTNPVSTAPHQRKTKPHVKKPKPCRSFAVFTCLDGVAALSSSGVKALNEQFDELDAYLQSETSFGDRWAYSNCKPASRLSVHELLEIEGKKLVDQTETPPTRERQIDYEKRVSLFNTANAIFEFFFPPDVEAPTVTKFWGAIKALFEVHFGNLFINGRFVSDFTAESVSLTSHGHPDDQQEPRISAWSLDKIATALRDIAIDVMSFNEIFVHAQQSDRAKITTPLTLIDAWMHLVLALATLPSDRMRSQELIWGASGLLKKGIEAMIDALPGQPVSKHSVVLPLELVSLMSMRVLKDVAPGMIPDNLNVPDISETYSSSLSAVESNISNSKIPDRGHERSLGLLKQEMAIIQWTIGTQHSIFIGMLTTTEMLNPGHGDSGRRGPSETKRHDSGRTIGFRETEYYPHETFGFEREPTMRVVPSELTASSIGGLRPLLIHECLRYLGRRERQFGGLLTHASQLEEENRNKISRTKDLQERAIYAFTIVTVIFLPLSAVASVFGMNSADIRDMELGQWAYWATAVPVTLVVMFLGLLFTGELGNVLRWIMSFGESGYGEDVMNSQPTKGKDDWGEN
ncbi:Magnesium transport protein CorA [Madurella mycetomatis]|nr:Magnesium transport protein CorA [Madurella mycetomatis]